MPLIHKAWCGGDMGLADDELVCWQRRGYGSVRGELSGKKGKYGDESVYRFNEFMQFVPD